MRCKWGMIGFQHFFKSLEVTCHRPVRLNIVMNALCPKSFASASLQNAMLCNRNNDLKLQGIRQFSRIGLLQWQNSRILVRTGVLGIHDDSKLPKQRAALRRVKRETSHQKGFLVSGYSTAEEYDLEQLETAVREQQLYRVVEDEGMLQTQDSENCSLDVLHIVATYSLEEEPREVFFFREGTAVFWNVSELEIANMLRFLRPFELNSYDEKLVLSEREMMSFLHSNSKRSVLHGGVIHLAEGSNPVLDKYTFSNGIALSVKLGVWEASLEKFIESIEFIAEDLKMGHKIRISREEVLRKQGELFEFRHLINLSSDLLDTPDFYWDNDELENLFMQIVAYFSINRRTRVMNEKLNHCVELVELVSSHLNDKHHIRLEWMIIVLIMVEVIFEVLHFLH